MIGVITTGKMPVRMLGLAITCAVFAVGFFLYTRSYGQSAQPESPVEIPADSVPHAFTYQHGARGCGFNGYGQQYLCSDGTEGYASNSVDLNEGGREHHWDTDLPSLEHELESATNVISRRPWQDENTREAGERVVAEFGDNATAKVRVFRVTKTRFFEVGAASYQQALDIEAIEDGDLERLERPSMYDARRNQ
jgi:hypothetical protein